MKFFIILFILTTILWSSVEDTVITNVLKSSLVLSSKTIDTIPPKDSCKQPPNMIFISAKDKTFQMGGNNIFDKNAHFVTLTKNYWMDMTEVTQKNYDSLMTKYYLTYYQKPNWFENIMDNFPAYNINWFEALLYCNAKTKAYGSKDTVYQYKRILGKIGNPEYGCVLEQLIINFSVKGFRLPTEAEWEFAAKCSSYNVDKVAWYTNNSINVHPVAKKEAHVRGLYDMLGNLSEWCFDWYQPYTGTPQIDPIVSIPTVFEKICRGGSYIDSTKNISPITRFPNNPDTATIFIGFRTCLPE
jgi:formylglycine-generating enzyme required for sulfatase activity